MEQSVQQETQTFAVLTETMLELWQGDLKQSEISYTAPIADSEDLWGNDAVNSLWSVALSPQDNQVAYQTGAGSVYLWNPTNTTKTQLHAGNSSRSRSSYRAPSLVFSPDGQTIAAIANTNLYLWRNDGTVLINPTDPPAASASSTRGLKYLTFSPDGSRIVTSIDGTIKLWDSQGRLLATLVDATEHEDWGSPPGLFAISPDSQQIATVYEETVALWGVEEGQLIKTMPLADTTATSGWGRGWDSIPPIFRFSPDGQVLVFMQRQVIQMWDPMGEIVATLSSESLLPLESDEWDRQYAAAHRFVGFDFHPNQPLLVTAQFNGQVHLWDFAGERVTTLQQGQTLPPLPEEEPHPLNLRFWWLQGKAIGTQQVQFQPDGQTIALIHQGALKLIDLNGRRLLAIRPNGKPMP